MTYYIYTDGYVPSFMFNTRDIKKFLASKGIYWTGMINDVEVANKSNFLDQEILMF